MREIIDQYAGMDEDGNVLPLADVYPGYDDEELEDMVEASEAERSRIYFEKVEETRLEAINDARVQGNFRNRNRALAKVARNAGESNQAWGAAQLNAMGLGDHIKGSSTAAERSLSREAQAKRMEELACRVCPIAEWCPQDDNRKLVVDTMMQIGPNGKKARSRFIDRVSGGKGGDESLNDHFCETNVDPARLRKDKA